MNRIRVKTEVLQKTVTSLQAISAKITAAGLVVRAAGLTARTYQQNTFGPQVRAICNEAGSIAGKHAGFVINLSGVLSKKTAAFLLADSSLLKALLKAMVFPVGLIGWKPGLDKGFQRPSVIGEKPIPSKPIESQPFAGAPSTRTYEYNANAPTDDCVQFVKGSRAVPGNAFNSNQFYSGAYRGKEGTRSDGTRYGQVPEPGAIMVESPSGSGGAGVTFGHASIITEVHYDGSNKPVTFKIAEANWGKTEAERKTVHSETFTWSESKGGYYSPSGKRSPDCFIY